MAKELGAKEEGYPDALEGAEEPVLQGLDCRLVLLDTEERFFLPINNEAVDREQSGQRDAEYQGDPEEAKHSFHDCSHPAVFRGAEKEREDGHGTKSGYARSYISEQPGTSLSIYAPTITMTFSDISVKSHRPVVHHV